MLNKLQFTLPSLEESFPNAPLIDGKINAVISLVPGSGEDEIFCKNNQVSGNCRVSYNIIKTPEIYASFGTAFSGEEVTINSKYVWYDPADDLHVYNWAKLGNQRLALQHNTEEGDSMINLKGSSDLHAKIPEATEAGMYEVVVNIDPGNSVQNEQDLICDFDKTNCYSSKILPAIATVSSTTGWSSGG